MLRASLDAFSNCGWAMPIIYSEIENISISLSNAFAFQKRLKKFNWSFEYACRWPDNKTYFNFRKWMNRHPYVIVFPLSVTFSQLCRRCNVVAAMSFRNVCISNTDYILYFENKEIWTEHVCSYVLCTCKCLTECH